MKKKILQAVNNYGNYSVGGVSFVYNQLVSYTDGSSTLNGVNFTVSGIPKVVVSGIPTITTPYRIYRINDIALVQGHKYLVTTIIDTLKGLIDRRVYIYYPTLKYLIGDKYWKDYIFTAEDNGNLRFYGGFRIDVEVSGEVQFVCVDLTDLETALGTTINTLEDFYSTDYGKQVKKGVYLPYAPTNTIYNATSPFRFSGDNLFDKSKANIFGGYIQGNELKSYAGEVIGTYASLYVIVKPNTTYTISRQIIGQRFAIATGNQLPSPTTTFTQNKLGYTNSSLTITTGSQDIYLYIWFYNKTFDVGINYLKILDSFMLVEGSTPKPYVKYIDRTFAPETPITLRSAQNIRDTWRNCSGKKNDLVGSIDLGSINYSFSHIGSTEKIWFRGYLRDAKKIPSSQISNCISAIYKTVSTDNIYTVNTDKTLGIFLGAGQQDPQVAICDKSFDNATDLKNSLIGVPLNYEKATPTTELAQSIALPKGITKVRDANNVELIITERN